MPTTETIADRTGTWSWRQFVAIQCEVNTEIKRFRCKVPRGLKNGKKSRITPMQAMV